MSAGEYKEPTRWEWAVARRIQARLSAGIFSREQLHLIRQVVLTELIDARDKNVQTALDSVQHTALYRKQREVIDTLTTHIQQMAALTGAVSGPE